MMFESNKSQMAGSGVGDEREHIGIWIALLVGVSLLASLPSSTAGVVLPSLDWFDEGHTLKYTITNGTASRTINATIDAKDGSMLTWRYWDVVNGSEEQLGLRFQDTNRTDYNGTDYLTYLWINATDVEEGVGSIIQLGDSSYTLDLITLDHFVISNSSWTFRYDIDKGWLDEADYGVTTVDLVSTRTSSFHVGVSGCESDGSASRSSQTCRRLTTWSRATVAFNSGNPCELALSGAVEAQWPGWGLFDYKWIINLDGDKKSDVVFSDQNDLIDGRDFFKSRGKDKVTDSAFVRAMIRVWSTPGFEDADKADARTSFSC